MTTTESLELGREAYAKHAWSDAFAQLSAAGEETLDLGDLERLAIAAHMLGRPDVATRLWERAYQAAVRAADPARAAGFAFHLIMGFGQRGDFAQAGGWHARAMRLIDEAGTECVERGYLLVPAALQALDSGDPGRAFSTFEQAGAIAVQFANPDLAAMSRLGRGQSLIAMGEVERGVGFLDESMVAVTAGEVSPLNVGIIYCASIEAFQALFDFRRAQEWTAALTRWCESQPDMAPFRGRCLVFRAEILQFHGLWQDAVDEVRRAHEWLSRPPIEPALGEAIYKRAELHRLRGEFAEAEAGYREASRWGRKPDPGLALLRLAQGDEGAAAATIRRALDEADGMTRPKLLEPFVEIMLARGDLDAARKAAGELADLASRSSAPLLDAIATGALGATQLASGDAKSALASLRRAWGLWQRLDAPYESAKVRVAIAVACRAVGDVDTATIELAAARDVFDGLGAVTDVARVDAIGGAPPATPGGLSAREVEVLRHLAGGGTNREIAATLGISERTVDRHVSNIFTKLDVSSRSAATAFAYEHRLV